MIEEWKDVVGWEGKYKVSNLGRVWNKLTDVEVSQVLTGIPRYKYVNLNFEGKHKLRRVHILVAEAFIENDENKPFVDHIDRDKFNNSLTNLRWATRSENNRNLHSTITVDDLHIKDYVMKFDKPDAAYTYILSRTCKGMDVSEAIEEYEEFLQYGFLRRKVEFEGQEYYLVDLAERFNVSYGTLNLRIRENWNLWNALTGIPESHRFSIQISGRGGVYHWYPTKEYFCTMHGMAQPTLSKLLDNNKCLQDILEWDGKDHLRQTVRGFTGTIKELCNHFEASEGGVLTRMQRKGMTLEDALFAPRGKVKLLSINGVYNTPKYWYESFGINAKNANSKKSKNDWSFKETLNHYGVDTSCLEICIF